MVETLVFLGAGASQPFGIPTMKSFVDIFEKELEKMDDRGLADAYSGIATPLKSVYGDNVDLEAIFTVLEGMEKGKTLKDLGYYQAFIFHRHAKRLPKSIAVPKISKHVAKMKEVLANLVRAYCAVRHDQREKIDRVYSEFFSLLGSVTHTTTKVGNRIRWDRRIFTTNYDNVLEEYWRQIRKFDFDTGFEIDRATGKHIMRPERLLDEGSKIVKLHGSITWKVEEDGSISEWIGPVEEAVGVTRFKGDVVLYPIQEKYAYEQPYLTMYLALDESLRKSKNWIVVGYSFNDPLIRHMFIKNSSKESRLILIHPKGGNVLETQLSEVPEKVAIERKFGEREALVEVAENIAGLIS